MEDTPVDFSLAPEALQIPCNPDVLILSSDLAHFVKANDSSSYIKVMMDIRNRIVIQNDMSK